MSPSKKPPITPELFDDQSVTPPTDAAIFGGGELGYMALDSVGGLYEAPRFPDAEPDDSNQKESRR